MAALCLSAVIAAIEETVEWFQWDVTYHHLALFLLLRSLFMERNQFWLALKLAIYLTYIQSWFGSRQKDVCLPNLSEYFFIKHKINKQDFKYFAIFLCCSTNRKDSHKTPEGKSFWMFLLIAVILIDVKLFLVVSPTHCLLWERCTPHSL